MAEKRGAGALAGALIGATYVTLLFFVLADDGPLGRWLDVPLLVVGLILAFTTLWPRRQVTTLLAGHCSPESTVGQVVQGDPHGGARRRRLPVGEVEPAWLTTSRRRGGRRSRRC